MASRYPLRNHQTPGFQIPVQVIPGTSKMPDRYVPGDKGTISPTKGCSLKTLCFHRIDPKDLDALKTLTIDLRAWPINGDGVRRGVQTAASTLDRKIVGWGALIEHLAAYVSDYQLSLTITCNTINDQTAEAITKPLSILPILSHCTIRLAHNSYQDQHLQYELQNNIRNTALRLTNRLVPPTKQPFTFSSLPVELQWQVLLCTDLVSLAVVECYEVIREMKTCCCHQPTLLAWEKEGNCCCSSARLGFSTRCTCWRFPWEVFLVSKLLNGYATRIFYSKNAFSVNTTWQHDPALQVFLRLGCDEVQNIKSLHFVFDNGLKRKKNWTIWEKAVQFMKENFTLEKLTLCIRVEDLHGNLHGEWERTRCFTKDMKERHRGYMEPLKKLRGGMMKDGGLKDLLVVVAYGEGKEEEAVALERIVMGMEYQSPVRGKNEVEDEVEEGVEG
ncbi:MAG: hypothetical protein MMC33_006521 [Icmadophila ericetorum]|nr:hypothetical protein [Icmadophila ericetorum]